MQILIPLVLLRPMRRTHMLHQRIDALTQTIQISVPITQNTSEPAVLARGGVAFHDEAGVHAVVFGWLRFRFVVVVGGSFVVGRAGVRADDPDVAHVDGDEDFAGWTAVVAGAGEGGMQWKFGVLEVEAVSAEEVAVWRFW